MVDSNGKFTIYTIVPTIRNGVTYYKEKDVTFVSPDTNLASIWVSNIKETKRKYENIFDKPVLILVNPKSGSGKSYEIYQTIVEPVLKKSEINYQTIITERRNHAKEIVSQDDVLSKWSAVVIVSGDGLLFEVYEGLDPDVIDKIPIGIIPGGSGNGLAHSLIRMNGDSHAQPVLGSVLNLVSRNIRPFDLMKVETDDGRSYHAFLSVGWGILADIDIESDKLRYFGEARFTIWGIIRVFKTRKYVGNLHYCPQGEPLEMSPLNRDVPSNWKSLMNQRFIAVYVVSQSMIGSDKCIAKDCRPDDGLMWILILKSGISKPDLAKVMVDMDNGLSVENEFVELIPVQAFRLEPKDNKGYLVIDGEVIQTQRVQAQIKPSFGKILSKK